MSSRNKIQNDDKKKKITSQKEKLTSTVVYWKKKKTILSNETKTEFNFSFKNVTLSHLPSHS